MRGMNNNELYIYYLNELFNVTSVQIKNRLKPTCFAEEIRTTFSLNDSDNDHASLVK